MKKATISVLIMVFLLGLLPKISNGQGTVQGNIKDANSGEDLINASVIIKGTSEGTTTDFDGNFKLTTKQPLPFTLLISYVGYKSQEYAIERFDEFIELQLLESAIFTDAIEVKERRITEKQRQSALTMETLDNIAIKETPAANFYDGLGALKEVDLTAASLGFKIINTRGFNSTSPVRSLQTIDGVDNQSPGLNFSLGNFLGASELDVNRVNVIIGASSAFYGPNAFNGVISMETKNPFLHKGLSVIAKVGERNLIETGCRWAQSLKNKKGYESFAYKINFAHFRADDWEANNYDPVFESPSGLENPGGYDAVNIYGDEYSTAFDLTNSPLSNPGVGIVYRRGYREVDLVDYDSDNTKVGLAFHLRLKPEEALESPELIFASNYSQGTTVYQGENRFSLRNIQFFQHRLELQKRNKYFLRAYVTHEDAGDSYDPYFTALLLQNNAKSDNSWIGNYLTAWKSIYAPRLRNLEGYPSISSCPPGGVDCFNQLYNEFINQPEVQELLTQWHQEAQVIANRGVATQLTEDFFEPGTARFQEEFDRITAAKSFEEGGTRFFDRSALAHVHGEYQFDDLIKENNKDLELVVGANARLYLPNSEGTILLDTFGRNINTFEYGIYGGGTLTLNNRWKISASVRMDKNQNFDYLFSPAASIIFNPTENQTLRLSFSSAIRNPTLADQYLNYNVGRAILAGNLNGFENLIPLDTLSNFLNTLNQDDLSFFDVDPIQPEKVKTFEVGYRAALGRSVYLDATYYFSIYDDFIGFNLGAEASFSPGFPIPTSIQVYRVSANATDQVTTQGFSVGLNYYLGKYYAFNGNYSWNKLNSETDDPIIPAFNTPEHKFNLGFSGRDMLIDLGFARIRNFGFNVHYKWIDAVLFEGSPQFTGIVPQYDLLDAQINWRAKKLNTTFKLGASNILDNQVFQVYGGPTIGRLAYFSILYEFKNL